MITGPKVERRKKQNYVVIRMAGIYNQPGMRSTTS
jgi:hypothetical protein